MTNDMSEDERAWREYDAKYRLDRLSTFKVALISEGFLAGRASLKGELEKLRTENNELRELAFILNNAGKPNAALLAALNNPHFAIKGGASRKALKETP